MECRSGEMNKQTYPENERRTNEQNERNIKELQHRQAGMKHGQINYQRIKEERKLINLQTDKIITLMEKNERQILSKLVEVDK